jgi:hypothetical protein
VLVNHQTSSQLSTLYPQTWIGLFRNGFCVIHDLELAGQALFGPIQTILPNMKVMNALIGPLQACAVVFSLKSASHLFAASVALNNVVHAWNEMLSEDGAETKTRFGYFFALSSLNTAKATITDNFRLASCKSFLAFGFFWLTLNSMKIVHFNFINIGLIFMEIAVAYLLVRMVRGVREQWKRAAVARTLAQHVSERGVKSALNSDENALTMTLGLISSAVGLPPPQAPWPGPPESYLMEAYVSKLESWRDTVIAKASSAQGAAQVVASLQAQAHGDVLGGWFDAVLIVINLVAFFGYLVFPVTFLLSPSTLVEWVPWWPTNELAQWIGNLVGDAAWTLEPALVLLFRPLIAASTASQLKRLAGAENKRK